jgi:UDP-GlcNAc3NAcA epimerase
MYDVMLATRCNARRISNILERECVCHGEYQLATLHRAENTDVYESLSKVISYLDAAAKDQLLLVPLHPRTREAMVRFGLKFERARIIGPVSYFDMIALLDGCSRVLTDSGGLQKEAYFFRKPCVTLRDTTEWVETIEAGWNRLWTQREYKPRTEISFYGDGHAAENVAMILEREI